MMSELSGKQFHSQATEPQQQSNLSAQASAAAGNGATTGKAPRLNLQHPLTMIASPHQPRHEAVSAASASVISDGTAPRKDSTFGKPREGGTTSCGLASPNDVQFPLAKLP